MLLRVLREVSKNVKEHAPGEIIGVVKIVMAQIFLIRAPVYAKGGNIVDPDQVLPPEEKEKVNNYLGGLRELPDQFTERYFKALEDPVGLVTILISELVEDCCFILEIPSLSPNDDADDDPNGLGDYVMVKSPSQVQEYEEFTGENGQGYTYGEDLGWKHFMIKKVLRAYNEPYLNLHFLGPFLKNNSASLSAYELIFQLLSALPVKWRSMVLQDIQKEIKDCKRHVSDQNGGQENSAYLDKLLPLYHIVMTMITNFLLPEEAKEIYKELSVVSFDLRLNPLPYGILPHEVVEMLDNEKVLPRISHLFKTSEDFPYLNHFDISLKEGKYSDEFCSLMQRH